jgi:hypothetical protein
MGLKKRRTKGEGGKETVAEEKSADLHALHVAKKEEGRERKKREGGKEGGGETVAEEEFAQLGLF